MATSEPEHFPPDERRLRRLLFAAACCLAVLIAPALYYLATGSIRPLAFPIAFAFLIAGAYLLRRWWWARNGAIMADDAGLWPAQAPRDTGMMRWEDVHSTEWSSLFEVLLLKDATGNTAMTLPIDLDGFGRLEAMLAEESRGHPDGTGHTLPEVYTVAFPTFLWPVASGIAIVLSLLSTGAAFAFLLAVISFIFWCLIIVSEPMVRISLENGRIRLSRLMEPLEIAREEVESISIRNPNGDHLPGSYVVVDLKWGKKPVVFPTTRYNPEDMLLRIETWLAEGSPGTEVSGQTAPTPASR